MKRIWILIAAIITLLISCDWRSWKEVETTDYAQHKDDIVFENDDLFIYSDSGRVVVCYPDGEYHPTNISRELKGIIHNEPSRVVFDSAKFDFNKVIAYFANTFNRRIK